VNKEIDSFGTEELELTYQKLNEKFAQDELILEDFLKLFYIKNQALEDLKEMKQLFTQQPETYNVLFCSRCGLETFNYYTINPPSPEEQEQVYLCIS
jgi:hypothetical protein